MRVDTSNEELLSSCREYLSKVPRVGDDEDRIVFRSFDVEIHLDDPPGTPLRGSFTQDPSGRRMSCGGYDEIHLRTVAAEDMVCGAELVTRFTYFGPGCRVQRNAEGVDELMEWLRRDLGDRRVLVSVAFETTRRATDCWHYHKEAMQCPGSHSLRGDDCVFPR